MLQNTSELSTQAGNAILGGGNGGNLLLRTGVFAAIGSSQISANAFSGSGGQVRIEARGFFLDDRSQLDASSELGIDGVVEVDNDTIITDPNLVSLSSELLTPNLLAQDCSTSNRDRFSIVDHRQTIGLFDRTLASTTTWHDDRDWRELMPTEAPSISTSGHRSAPSLTTTPTTTPTATPTTTPQALIDTTFQATSALDPTTPLKFLEASRWYYDDGRIQLGDSAAVTPDHGRSPSCVMPSPRSPELPTHSPSSEVESQTQSQ
ncbi:MAG: hypothetical protein HC795_01845 [Coleofasciculaceae cyanobacterium RL_1_1]|nr:hypothetical protein [Coleofasciculaceae cyanobacterium RL_1_1]